MRPSRTRALAMIMLGGAMVVTPFMLPVADAQDVELIGFLGLADSDAITQTGGDPTQAGHPQVQAKTAHTYSSLDTGPNGLALASSAWPGELAGNAGSLFQVFGAPEEAGALNYPVRAEASTAGPAETTQPGMTARVKGPRAEAIATSGGFDGDGSELITYGDVESVSRSEVVAGKVVVTATARVSDVSIGGTITMDAVETVAIVRSDGTTGSREGFATVSGLEIGGQPARVDEDGVHAGDGTSDNPGDAVSQALMEQVLSHFEQGVKVEMYMSKPRSRDEGNVQEYRSGALIIDMTLGDPEAGQGGYGTIAIGGSNAYVQATAGTPFSAPAPTEAVAPPPNTPQPASGGFETAPTASDAGFSAPDAPTATDESTPSGGSDPVQIAAPALLDTIPIVDRFSGGGFIMPFIVLLGGLLAGRGLVRFHLAVSQATTTACIIDGERS